MAEVSYIFDGQAISQTEWERVARSLSVDDGVVPGILSNLKVDPTSPASMNVIVRSGWATVRGFTYVNDSDKTLPIGAAPPADSRIDVVALRLDRTAKTITAVVIQGSAAPNPTPPPLTDNATVTEIALAHVTVSVGQTTVTSANIADKRSFRVSSASAGGKAFTDPVFLVLI